ncbi:MAG: glycosyltransferase, partial [Planctomycetes bacterium]|nr:glycosyltransferase [Planctomycetota bacterium]
CLTSNDYFWWQSLGVATAVHIPNPLTFSPRKTPPAVPPRRLLFIGRMVRQKGFDVLPGLMSRLAARFPDITLTILGDFEKEKHRKAFLQSLRLAKVLESVDFVGFVKNINPYLEKSAVLVMPSLFEGHPMVRMEACAFGVPVVMFDMPYLEPNGEEAGCLVVDKGNVQQMADTIGTLLDDEAAWRRLSRNAISCLENFMPERVAEKWEELFVAISRGTVEKTYAPPESIPLDRLGLTLKESLAATTYLLRQARRYHYLAPLDRCITLVFPIESRRRRCIAATLATIARYFREKRKRGIIQKCKSG